MQTTPTHHALWDARHDRAMHDVILKAMGQYPSPAKAPIGEEELRTLAVSAQRRGPGLTLGRTKEELAAGMPPWMRDAVDAYVPGMAELRAAAEVSTARYRSGLVRWLDTLD